MEEVNLHFDFNARYFKQGKLSPTTKQLWYVLHGYGQLAEHFLKKFKSLEDRGICVIAPEGLSRFYLEDLEKRSKGGSDRVGASWMTKENRVMDIANYLTCLNAINALEAKGINVPVTILGFSQGAATATRWVLQGTVQFQRLILWAGIFPPDMDFEAGHKVLASKDVLAVFGNHDPFVTPARLQEMNMLCDKLGIQPHVIRFEGRHEIDEATHLGLI